MTMATGMVIAFFVVLDLYPLRLSFVHERARVSMDTRPLHPLCLGVTECYAVLLFAVPLSIHGPCLAREGAHSLLTVVLAVFLPGSLAVAGMTPPWANSWQEGR
jgi:hypothetical protein